MANSARPDTQRRQDGDHNDDSPNRSSNQEQAEGSRENVNTGKGAGITNRPLDEERERQAELPPRGESKGGSHA